MTTPDDGPDPDDGPPAVPCSHVLLRVVLSGPGQEQDLVCLSDVVEQWRQRTRAARGEWRPPASEAAPPPWQAEVYPASPLSIEVMISGAFFSQKALNELILALQQSRQQGVPIVEIAFD